MKKISIIDDTQLEFFISNNFTNRKGIILLMIPKKILLHVELLSKYDLKISSKSNKRLPRDEPSLFQLSYFFSTFQRIQVFSTSILM